MVSYTKLSKITLIYIMLLGLFSRYTEHYYLWKIIFLCMFGCLCVSRKFVKQLCKIISNKYLIFSIAISLFSICFSNNNMYLISNLNLLLWLFLFMITIVTIFLSEPENVSTVLKKSCLPLNVLMIINLVILIIQCMGIPIFIKNSWRELNSYYEDLCCGLFGYNGTHELTMFLLFMNAFNLSSWSNCRKNKKAFIVYICIVDVLIALTSTKNDNIAMVLLIPFFLVVYLLVIEYLKKEKISIILNKFGRYIVILCVMVLVAFMIPSTRKFINEYVLIRVNMVINVTNPRYQINGSNERLAIPLNALYHINGWLFGEGIGAASYGGGSFFGYNHFGLSSIGTLVMTGGIWFYLFYTLFYAKTIMKMVKSRHKFPEILCFGLIVLLTIYTIFYTSFVTTIWYTFFFMVIGNDKNKRGLRTRYSNGSKI